VNRLSWEHGSFRDKANRVFYRDGEVYRALSPQAFENWKLLSTMPFFNRLMSEGRVIGTQVAAKDILPDAFRGWWAAVLKHDRIPFISYPYEWSFDMLRDAALPQLALLEDALEENMILKDASSFNIQWRGTQPVFIDIPSFVPWNDGQSWVGYRQFCQLFLFPLMLQAYRDISFQPWIRGSIDGITAEQCLRFLASYFYKPGVLKDVIIHAWFQRDFAATSRRVGEDLRRAGFHKELIQANLRRLTKLVQGLTWKARKTAWSSYPEECSYSGPDYQAKLAYVERFARRKPRRLVWDLGCNRGDFSKVVAAHADAVVALDGDERVVNDLYRLLRSGGPRNILPLVMNLADPSTGIGWLGRERKAFSERDRPDLILCLALIHHLTITANIPMTEWIQWLSEFGADLLIEFVEPSDPMTQRLLLNKEGDHQEYNKHVFQAILSEYFNILERHELRSGNRVLYACEVKRDL
jgi:hypothetical protein